MPQCMCPISPSGKWRCYKAWVAFGWRCHCENGWTGPSPRRSCAGTAFPRRLPPRWQPSRIRFTATRLTEFWWRPLECWVRPCSRVIVESRMPRSPQRWAETQRDALSPATPWPSTAATAWRGSFRSRSSTAWRPFSPSPKARLRRSNSSSAAACSANRPFRLKAPGQDFSERRPSTRLPGNRSGTTSPSWTTGVPFTSTCVMPADGWKGCR